MNKNTNNCNEKVELERERESFKATENGVIPQQKMKDGEEQRKRKMGERGERERE